MYRWNLESFRSRMLRLFSIVVIGSSVSVLPAHATLSGPDILITAVDAAGNSASYKAQGA